MCLYLVKTLNTSHYECLKRLNGSLFKESYVPADGDT